MKKLLFTSLSCFILLGFLNSASAATTVISTANGSTTIVSDPTSGTYTPGSAIQVYITSIATNDPYVTNVLVTGDGTTVYSGGVPASNITTTVGTAGAPASGLGIAMSATVTTNVPTSIASGGSCYDGSHRNDYYYSYCSASISVSRASDTWVCVGTYANGCVATVTIPAGDTNAEGLGLDIESFSYVSGRWCIPGAWDAATGLDIPIAPLSQC